MERDIFEGRNSMLWYVLGGIGREISNDLHGKGMEGGTLVIDWHLYRENEPVFSCTTGNYRNLGELFVCVDLKDRLSECIYERANAVSLKREVGKELPFKTSLRKVMVLEESICGKGKQIIVRSRVLLDLLDLE